MAEAVEAIVAHRAGMMLWRVFGMASPLGHGLTLWLEVGRRMCPP